VVSEWVDKLRSDRPKDNQIKTRAGYLSLDEGDNELVRFWTYFIAALNHVGEIVATFGNVALSILQSPQPPPTETVLTPLINEIATIPDRIIFVLDDYHDIERKYSNWH
jgi:LuxR family maltose regulon positive regulatory protein